MRSPMPPRCRSSNTWRNGSASLSSWTPSGPWRGGFRPGRPSSSSRATRSRSFARPGARPWSANTCNNPFRATSYARTGACRVEVRARHGPGGKRVRMKGTLGHRAAGDVLADIQRRQVSGIFRLQKDTTTRQMFIDAGVMIRFAVSTLPTESITALFRDKGGVTEEQVRQATAAKQPQELLGTTLVRMGFLSKETLADLTREHIHRVVIGALTMREGAYKLLRLFRGCRLTH